MLINRIEVLRELCTRSFFDFENTLHPEFFKFDRQHLIKLADTLEKLYNRKLLRTNGKPYTKLMINMPPRFGKSFSLINFETWVLGKNRKEKILSVSYNETLSVRFSKAVRDQIEQTRLDGDRFIFSDIFPKTKIKRGDAAAQLWSLNDNFFNYLGGSIRGTITGFGATIGVIDDPLKSRDDAYNENVKQDQYDWYKDTFLSRLEEGALQIINMTRWATNDLCGRLLEEFPKDWYVLKIEATNDNGEMVCPELMSKETYIDKKNTTSKEIFMANYHQKPMDIEGRLYKNLKTYKELPEGKVYNYTDTADEGNCYLCSICYVEHKGEVYIKDVLYTGAGMDVTELQTAEMFFKNKVNIANIESNNGGRGFARAVERILKEKFNSNYTVVKWFTQTKNKQTRIIVNSNWIMEHVYFPENWHILFPEFHKDISFYTKDGKGQRDDAPDALTGVAEKINTQKLYIY